MREACKMAWDAATRQAANVQEKGFAFSPLTFDQWYDATLGKGVSVTVTLDGEFLLATSALKAEPCLMQSAFTLENGIRMIVYTGYVNDEAIIRSFVCDENWKPVGKPFAECPLSWSKRTAREYHAHVRTLHKPEALNVEHSTEL